MQKKFKFTKTLQKNYQISLTFNNLRLVEFNQFKSNFFNTS